jgi:hypothetical protein
VRGKAGKRGPLDIHKREVGGEEHEIGEKTPAHRAGGDDEPAAGCFRGGGAPASPGEPSTNAAGGPEFAQRAAPAPETAAAQKATGAQGTAAEAAPPAGNAVASLTPEPGNSCPGAIAPPPTGHKNKSGSLAAPRFASVFVRRISAKAVQAEAPQKRCSFSICYRFCARWSHPPPFYNSSVTPVQGQMQAEKCALWKSRGIAFERDGTQRSRRTQRAQNLKRPGDSCEQFVRRPISA